jgi:LemA protein
MRKLMSWALPLLAALLLSGCGYNEFQTRDEQVKAAWSEVLNQYKRRADLIPNLVNTVQGYAAHEREVLTGVTEARARATSVQLPPEALDNPEAVRRFQEAQGQLSGALGRLLVVAENYPQLKYNILARQFPTNLTAMMFGYKPRASFEVENEKAISEPPKVDFAPKSAVPAAPSATSPSPPSAPKTPTQ